jgi:hypothetical protein
MKNFTLKFGKYKGMQFLSTPASYQNWLLSQDWFKVPNVDLKQYALIENGKIHTDELSYEDAMEMLNRHKNCFPMNDWKVLESNQVLGMDKAEGILQRHARIAARYA